MSEGGGGGSGGGVRRDRPWLMRTYSGHSSAEASNALYRENLSRGQTGLSVAFDLPTQTGYDADHPLARGEVGKVGVPIAHLDDLDQLFAQLPLEEMNTSMTINATAAWLLALYVALAERRGVALADLRGTTQNDILKEYLARGTYIFPPAPSLRLVSDVIAYSVERLPQWNPINICSYHLQEAGATPAQELAYALASAQTVLDTLRASGQVDEAALPQVVGRVSFFVNAGIRFVEELCKLRAFSLLWDRLCHERYGVEDAMLRRFRYGVQVNSLGLTEQQPENNVQRIVFEMLSVVLSKRARARAVQLPAWNEALGLPRPWDQQWSLRIQQVLAYETDLLEYDDLFDGSTVIERKVATLIAAAEGEMQRVAALGGMGSAIDSGYVKRELVRSQAMRLRAIERGEQKIVGVNCFRESAPSPLVEGGRPQILRVDASAEGEQLARLEAHRRRRDAGKVASALRALEGAARGGENIMISSIACAHAGVTTGEWAQTLREVFGEYRSATGVDIGASLPGDVRRVEAIRRAVVQTSKALGRPLKILVGKPGLDGHSNGAEQIAIKARDLGFEVVYQGIRSTVDQISVAAEEESVHMIGLSLLSGSHVELTCALLAALRARGLDVPVVLGGIIPGADHARLRAAGVSAIFTPRDGDLNAVVAEMLAIVRARCSLPPLAGLEPRP